MLPEGRCERCAFAAPCLCARIPRVETAVRIDVVRHAAEQWKTTNSVRWAQLALGDRCRVFEYGHVDRQFDATELGALEGTWLLFPSPHPTPLPAVAPHRLIVPDGTWQQARRMVSRIAPLRALPRLTLPADPRTRLRRQHLPHGLATIEAIAAALELLGDQRAASSLRDVYQLALDVIVERRGFPLDP